MQRTPLWTDELLHRLVAAVAPWLSRTIDAMPASKVRG